MNRIWRAAALGFAVLALSKGAFAQVEHESVSAAPIGVHAPVLEYAVPAPVKVSDDEDWHNRRWHDREWHEREWREREWRERERREREWRERQRR